VAAAGHSLGSITAARITGQDRRIDAGAALDGTRSARPAWTGRS